MDDKSFPSIDARSVYDLENGRCPASLLASEGTFAAYLDSIIPNDGRIWVSIPHYQNPGKFIELEVRRKGRYSVEVTDVIHDNGLLPFGMAEASSYAEATLREMAFES